MTRPYRKKILAFFVLTTLGISSWVIAPFVVRTLINTISDLGVVTSKAWWLVGLFVLIRFCDEWFWRSAEWIMKSMKPQMIEGVRSSLFAAVLHKPYSFFVNSSSGRIGHWINQTTSTMNNMVDTTIWGVWPRAMTLVLSAFFLFFTHWSLALLFAVWLITLFRFTIVRGRVFSKLVEKQSNATSKVSGQAVDAVSNHVSVRVFNSRRYEMRALQHTQQEVLHHWHKSWAQHYVTNIVKGTSVAVVGGIALVLILNLYSAGEITVGDIVLFVAYFHDASSSLWELSWQLDQYYNEFGRVNNALKGILSAQDERTVEEGEINVPNSAKVTLDKVSFAYPEKPDVQVLSSLSVEVAAGKKIGVVGHSGAGKSTLVGLLLGFYEPSTGQIKINDIDVSTKDPSFVRAISSYVPQDTNLFNRTIRQNILYARPDATDEDIKLALQRAEALDFVEKLPKGLDTLVGERGVKLSGGQRQRIAIARAILKNSPLLILDEATSALDSISEQAIQKALHELMKGRTAIVIAHRLSTLKHLDEILVIESGKIVEQGSHDELLQLKKGIYADLWRRQKDGFIVE
jgi:ATP-binding cassette subfamily B protein